MSNKPNSLSLYDFGMMQLITGPRAVAFLKELEAVGPGEQTVSTYDPVTGFCIKVHTLDRQPVQWFMQGPLTEDQASRALPHMGWAPMAQQPGRTH